MYFPCGIRPIVAISVLLLSACAPGDKSESEPVIIETERVFIDYEGLTSQGVVNKDSAADIVRAISLVLDTDTSSFASKQDTFVSIKNEAQTFVLLKPLLSKKKLALRNTNISYKQASRNYCENGTGYIETTSTKNADSDYYSNCLISHKIFNGTVITEFIDSSPTLIHARSIIQNMNTKYVSNINSQSYEYQSNIDISGTSEITLEIDSGNYVTSETYKHNWVLRDNLLNTSAQIKDLTEFINNLNGSTSIDGTLLVSNYGEFSVTTESLFDYYSGILKISGENSSLLLTVTLGNNYDRLDRIDIDIDQNNNGVTDFHYQLSPSLVYTPAFTDLNDDDNDGMFNSFEQYFGTNPLNASDKEMDTDGDGAPNLQELLFQTDPGDSNSMPIISDMALTPTQIDFKRLPNNYYFYLSVGFQNDRSIAEFDRSTILKIKLPDNIEYIKNEYGLSFSNMDCNLDKKTIVCIGDRRYGSQIFKLKTTGIGSSYFNIQLTNPDADIDLSNNSETLDIEVVKNDGEVLDISTSTENTTTYLPPGNYIYNFASIRNGSKLISTDGPETTFLYPKRHFDDGYPSSSSINMGTNSELNGFTIPVQFSTLGADDNATIKNNIFIGNFVSDNLDFSSNLPTGSVFGFGYATNLMFENNIIRDICFSTPSNSNFPPVFELSGYKGTAKVIMQNNIFSNNKCSLFRASVTGYELILTNNTFYNNYRIIDSYGFPSFKLNFSNNIFSSNNSITTPWYNDQLVNAGNLNIDLANSNFTNNLFYNNVFHNTYDTRTANFDDAYSGFNGNIKANPYFLNPEKFDFRLQPGSLAIDAGNIESAPAYDIEGYERPVDGDNDGVYGYDIGAYEYH